MGRSVWPYDPPMDLCSFFNTQQVSAGRRLVVLCTRLEWSPATVTLSKSNSRNKIKEEVETKGAVHRDMRASIGLGPPSLFDEHECISMSHSRMCDDISYH
jgi:hypothetical protein